MKVVINRKTGGFDVSQLALERMIGVGFTVGGNDSEADIRRDPINGQLWLSMSIGSQQNLRCDPRFVQIVEELGEKANNSYCELKIVEIPFQTIDGWYIDESDCGIESIHEAHRVWF